MKKWKPPKTKSPILLVGEGKSDCTLLNYLRLQYLKRGSNKTAQKAMDMYGGGPWTVIEKAIRLMRRGHYEATVVLVDIDRKDEEGELRSILEPQLTALSTHGLLICWSEPCCLEGMLIDAMGKRCPITSSECKSAWNKHFPNRSLKEMRTYELLFPRSKLEHMRLECKTMDLIISVLE